MPREYLLPLLFLCLSVLSLTVLASIAPHLILNQAIYVVIGGVIIGGTARIPWAKWQKYHQYAYAVAIFLLTLTLMIGVVRKGATRWIPIGPVHIQPSQIAQPLTFLTLASFLASNSMKKMPNLLRAAGIVGLPWFLIVIEPNLGTSLVLIISAGMMMFLTDLPTKKIVGSIGIAFISALLAWNLFLHDYQKQRVLSFMDPDSHSDASYNAQQSLIAVGSGRLFGRGLGHGVQSQLRFLPERQTDFIFASYAEELGFFSVMILLSLYGGLTSTLLWWAIHAKTPMMGLFLAGVTTQFLVHLMINIGMNMGLMPITGITLPFMSYGGSSLMSFAFSLGIAQRVIIESKPKVLTIN